MSILYYIAAVITFYLSNKYGDANYIYYGLAMLGFAELNNIRSAILRK